MKEETIFDKILEGKIPADVVYQDQDVFAFRDIHPQAPVHVLILPRQKVTGFPQIQTQSDEIIGRLFKKASYIATLLNLDEGGYRIVVNSGTHGLQTVDYLHVHLLGGRAMGWPPG